MKGSTKKFLNAIKETEYELDSCDFYFEKEFDLIEAKKFALVFGPYGIILCNKFSQPPQPVFKAVCRVHAQGDLAVCFTSLEDLEPLHFDIICGGYDEAS